MKVSRQQIADRLKLVIDPELGINVVDLGLIYQIDIDGGAVGIELTMTTPACPLSRYIMRNAEHVVGRVDGVRDVRIDLVWSPPWSRGMINRAALSQIYQ